MTDDDINLVKVLWGVFGVGLAIGLIVLGWAYFLGPLSNQVEYNNFNTSPQHLNAVAQKVSDDCTQLAETSDPVAKKAIEQDIVSNVATVNLSQLSMPESVKTCVTNAEHDVQK